MKVIMIGVYSELLLPGQINPLNDRQSEQAALRTSRKTRDITESGFPTQMCLFGRLDVETRVESER